MGKARNIAFIAVIATLLFGAIVYTALDKLVPAIEAPKKSAIEGREYEKASTLLKKSPLKGEFQDSFELFTADRVPFRENLILLSASLQRQGIATAAFFAGYKVYPTYYDSSHVVYPEGNYLFETVQGTPKKKDDLNALVKTINEAAKNHPDVRFVVGQTLKARHMKANPTHDLVTGKSIFDGQWVQKNFLDKLDSSITTRLDDCETVEEIMEGWFNTDHHWRLERALAMYNWIADELDLKHATWNAEKEILVSRAWEGSLARFGRDTGISSTLVDQGDDFSALEYHKLTKKGPGDTFTPGTRDAVLSKEGDKSDSLPIYSAYTHYYGNGESAYITNSGDNNGKTCLFVSDSYGFCLKNYIGSSYKTTIAIFPGNQKVKHSLSWYIDTYDVDDVIFLTNGKKYQNIVSKSPKFVGLDI